MQSVCPEFSPLKARHGKETSMEAPSIERKLTTILHADVAGYSRLMARMN